MSARTRILLGLAAAGLCVSAVVPAAAQASPTLNNGEIIVCNASSALERFSWPDHGNLSVILRPGNCSGWSPQGVANDVVNAYRQQSNGTMAFVGSKHFSDGQFLTWRI
jgi:hypothetical protein